MNENKCLYFLISCDSDILQDQDAFLPAHSHPLLFQMRLWLYIINKW